VFTLRDGVSDTPSVAGPLGPAAGRVRSGYAPVARPLAIAVAVAAASLISSIPPPTTI
jgi:hypothetical protein